MKWDIKRCNASNGLPHEIEMNHRWYRRINVHELESEPSNSFQLSISSWFYNFNFMFFKGIAKRHVKWATFFLEVMGNPLKNFGGSVRGYWQPSEKFATGPQMVLVTLWGHLQLLQVKYIVHICQMFALPSHHVSESGEYPGEELPHGIG